MTHRQRWNNDWQRETPRIPWFSPTVPPFPFSLSPFPFFSSPHRPPFPLFPFPLPLLWLEPQICFGGFCGSVEGFFGDVFPGGVTHFGVEGFVVGAGANDDGHGDGMAEN